MLLTVKIKLTTPILGELRPDKKTGVRNIKCSSTGRVAVDRKHWDEQFWAAEGVLHSKLDVGTILYPKDYEKPSTHIFRRTWSGNQVEQFASIRGGTVLTLEFGIREDKDNCFTKQSFTSLLKIVGEHFGLSQWGSKFDFGRFIVLSVEEKVE